MTYNEARARAVFQSLIGRLKTQQFYAPATMSTQFQSLIGRLKTATYRDVA